MDVLRAGLQKLAEISLAGVSPESAVQHMAPAGAMETSGLARAQAILNRHQSQPMQKTAAPRVSNALVPGANSLTGAKKKRAKDRGPVSEGKSFGGHTIGGAAAGRLAVDMAHPHAPSSGAAKAMLHHRRWQGLVVGAGVGAAEFARKRLVERHREAVKKHASILSPGMSLRASQQVGKMSKGLRTSITPPVKAQVPGV